jgi:hypothetical protein
MQGLTTYVLCILPVLQCSCHRSQLPDLLRNCDIVALSVLDSELCVLCRY